MSPEEIEAIAQRKSYCAPFDVRVSLSGAERDALVAMARHTTRYQEVLYEVSEYLTCVVDGGMSRNNASALAAELQAQIDAAMPKESP